METSSAVAKSAKSVDEELIIVLHIEEGIGLNAAESILLEASLSGHKLESEPVRPGHTTLFDCDLVWETDKKSMRRMKMENLPLRLDCYALRNSKGGDIKNATKEHIGYVLFQVKNIPVVSISKAAEFKTKWVKVIGLSKDWRTYKPEFLIKVMATTKDFLTAANLNESLESQRLESVESIVFDENPVIPSMMTSQRGIFIRLLKKEGLLQVGNIDTNCDVFTVTITIKNIRYLDNIKLDNELRGKIHMDYVLLGNPHSLTLEKKFNRSYPIQEKVSINFRSSLVDLKEYFEEIFFIPIEFLAGEEVLGTAQIKANQLIKTTSLQEFLEKNPTQRLEFDEICNIDMRNKELQPSSHRPIVEYKLSIKYIATKKLHQTECLDNYKRSNEIDLQAGGDFVEEPLPSPRSQKPKTLSDIQEYRSESEKSHQIKSLGAPKSNEPINILVEPKPRSVNLNQEDSSELPRLFSYNLQLSTIKFNRTPEKGIWQFSFFHDKSDTPRAFMNKELKQSDFDEENQLSLSDFELKLYFTSSPSNIVDLISSSDSCALCIKGPRGTHAKAQLDCHNLLIGNREKAPGLVLMQDKSGQIIAMAKLSVHLENLGINFNARLKTTTSQVIQDTFEVPRMDFNVTKTFDDNQKMSIIDENFTHKIVEELDEWKKHQQSNFLKDLKNKEELLVEKLKTNWTQKQQIYEQDLVSRADKLSSLTVAMEEAHKSLKEKERNFTKEEKEIAIIKHELEKSYNTQLMAIRERARRMEDDLLHEMKLKDIRFEDISRCNQHMKTENCELNQKNEALLKELHDLKANLVPKCEVEKILQEMRLLKEKFEATQQSKLFYKEQWAKSCRENHKVRRENIFTEKGNSYSLQCDRLSNVIDDQNFQLNMDKQELDQIKHLLDGDV